MRQWQEESTTFARRIDSMRDGAVRRSLGELNEVGSFEVVADDAVLDY